MPVSIRVERIPDLGDRPTSPRWACEYDDLVIPIESLGNHIETVSSDPYDLLLNAINLCIVLRTGYCFRVLLDGKYLFPSALARKSNRITADTTKGINDDCFSLWNRL